jgi:hypothetical protein
LQVARRRRGEHYRACGALAAPRAARSTRTLGMKTCSTESASLEVSDTEYIRLSTVERYSDGSGYSCFLDVCAGEFRCEGHRFDFDNLLHFLERLQTIYESLSGEAELRHRNDEEYLQFAMDRRGHVSVNGLVTDYRECRLTFRLEADQTYLFGFLSSLYRIYDELHA